MPLFAAFLLLPHPEMNRSNEAKFRISGNSIKTLEGNDFMHYGDFGLVLKLIKNIANKLTINRWSDVYLGESAFKDKLQLHLVLGHELNHVAMNYFNLPQSEAFCYNWMVNSCLFNNNFDRAKVYMDYAESHQYFSSDFTQYYKYGSFGIPFKVGNVQFQP
jgi:hypothetical protein